MYHDGICKEEKKILSARRTNKYFYFKNDSYAVGILRVSKYKFFRTTIFIIYNNIFGYISTIPAKSVRQNTRTLFN